MATVSGMKYSEVKDLVDFLRVKADSIDAVMNSLSEEMPGKIANVYSGEAAETFKTTLKTCAATIQTTLNELITGLSVQADTKQAEYQSQETTLAESATTV